MGFQLLFAQKSIRLRFKRFKRAKIIILRKTGKNYREIAKILKMSLCSVYTAIRRYRETGQNTNRKRSGRPRKTNQRIDNKIYAISKGNRQKSTSEIRAEINEDLDSPISLTTVKGRLKEKGMIGRIDVRKPLLRPVNEQKRLKFAQEHVDWTIDQWKSVHGQSNQNSNFSVAIGVNMFAEKSMKDSNQIVLCQL